MNFIRHGLERLGAYVANRRVTPAAAVPTFDPGNTLSRAACFVAYSGVTDEQWAWIEPHIPPNPSGRPREMIVRYVVDVVFYVLHTGCQRKFLSKDFPPACTREWRQNGTLDVIHDLLREMVRTRKKPHSPWTTASWLEPNDGDAEFGYRAVA